LGEAWRFALQQLELIESLLVALLPKQPHPKFISLAGFDRNGDLD
jgi:hypothetical protein